MVLAFVPPSLEMLAASPDAVRQHPGWPPTLDGIKLCQEVCREHGIPLVVALLPSKASVYAWHVIDQISPEDAMRAMLRPPARAAELAWKRDARRWRNGLTVVVRETCAELDIPYLDLRPPFFQAADRGDPQTYFSYGSHWNAAGHALAARATADFLLARPELLDSTPERP